MAKKILVLCLSALFMTSACDKADDISSNNPNAAEQPNLPNNTEPTGDERYLNEKSDYIFDQDKLHTFELNLAPESLAFLDNDPTAEDYVEGSLTFEGETLGAVGIRYKGSVGAFVNCLTGRDWANPSGSKTCTKLSMKIKINWDDSSDKFYGLKKLQFHSQNLDDSQMRERLGYHLFREMGVPAPRSVHARIMINGQYSGLYALTEQIDGRFTKQKFEDGDGNLYKEVWPLNSEGQPHSDQTYIKALKTNEDDNPSVEMITGFAKEVAEASDVNLQSVIEKWMDIDEVLSYAVVDRTIRNDDGAFHWYCDGSSCNPHNFYWYEEPTNKTMHLIPWDLDNAFENIVSNANPVTPIVDDWGGISNNCEPFSAGILFLRQKSAACDKLTRGWASYVDEYQNKLEAFKQGPLSEHAVNTLLDKWYEQIKEATLEASAAHSDAINMLEWDRAFARLKSDLNVARS